MKDLFINIWGPQIGSLWGVKNIYWCSSGFASNKDPESKHPGMVVDEEITREIFQVAPGTSRYHPSSINVFCVTLDPVNRPDYTSYFLINLSIPMHKVHFHNISFGWWGRTLLDVDDLERLKKQMRSFKKEKR